VTLLLAKPIAPLLSFAEGGDNCLSTSDELHHGLVNH